MVSRLKFDIGDLIDEQFSHFPIYIWESDTTTFCDLNMGGGQFIQKVGEWLRKFGHSDENIRKRVFGFSEKPFYLSYIKSNPSLIGTFDVYNENINMKFDVQVGNDPYQESVGPNKNQTLWDKLFHKRILLLNDGGYLALTHPSGWRNVSGKFKSIQDIMKSKRLLYLNMNNTKDGKKLFGVNTDYDYYVLHNSQNNYQLTKVIDYSNKETNIDLSNKEFIPNSNLELTYSLVAKPEEEKVTILYSSSAYETRNSNTNEHKTDEFKYPCVYTVGSNNPNFWYSSVNDRGHFGIPKVIWGNGLTDVIIDRGGEYGLTQFAYAIADNVENLDNIYKALKSEKFIKEVMGYESGVGHIYNRKVISTFRKDFWKEFIDD